MIHDLCFEKGVIAIPKGTFERQALRLLAASSGQGCTLMDFLAQTRHGRAWTPRTARKHLIRMADAGLIHHDGAFMGRRWFALAA